MYIHTCSKYVHTYMYVYTCIHACIFMHTCMYTYAYTHTHTCSRPRLYLPNLHCSSGKSLHIQSWSRSDTGMVFLHCCIYHFLLLTLAKQLSVSFLLFNGFSVVNWYYKALKAVFRPTMISQVAVKAAVAAIRIIRCCNTYRCRCDTDIVFMHRSSYHFLLKAAAAAMRTPLFGMPAMFSKILSPPASLVVPIRTLTGFPSCVYMCV